MPVPVPETPLESLVNTRPSPEVLDTLAYEIVEEHQPAFVRGNYGMANADPEAPPQGYEGFQLVKEESIAHDKVKRWWYNGAVNQDCYNYDEDYVLDSADHPLFKRRYITRRDLYATLTRGAAGTLTGVWMVVVTNGGTQYDPNNPPAVTIAAGGGNTATATALVKPDGSVGWIYITSEGDGYVAAPVVTIAPSSGVQATATATIQSTSCVLISQDIKELPQQDPRSSLYVMETRVYQTFPGPVIIEWRHIPKLGIYALLAKQLILNSTIPGDNNFPGLYPTGVTVEYQELTAVYGVKITTTLPTTGFAWEDASTPNDYIYEGTEDYRWPDQLPVIPQVNLLVAGNSSGFAFDYALVYKVKEGYVGPCRAIFKERYTFDPTDAAFIADLPVPTQVFPDAHTVITGIIAYPANGAPNARYLTWPIPATLHPAFSYSTNPIIVNGNMALPPTGETFINGDVPATVPPGFSTGDSILRASAPQRVGIGDLWVVYIVEIFYP